MVPPGTDLKTLVPSITHNGADISPASGVAQNFYSAGAYSPVVYTVTAEDGSTVLWTITVGLQPWTSLGEASLASASGGDAASDPILLPVAINLADTGGNGWADLLSVLQSAGKYVALDLSASTMSGGGFDPGSANSGENRIVSLVLPDATTGITGANYSTPTFRYFTSLTSLSAEQVTSVGVYAFYGCSSLSTLSLPRATEIGYEAFDGCTSLNTVELPQATDIGEWAFKSCSSLSTLSLPQATSISANAFPGCTSLSTVDLPQATDIGQGTFSGCTSLSTLSLPQATSIGTRAFAGCTSLNTVSLPQATNIGDSAFWGCTSLSTLSLPKAASIGRAAFSRCWAFSTLSLPLAVSIGVSAFDGCSSLSTISLPQATSIGTRAFASTGNQELSITLGSTVPSLGVEMFWAATKTVSVQVPSGASGSYGSAPANTSDDNWGNGFRGGGWDGSAMTDSSTVNSYITLKISPIGA